MSDLSLFLSTAVFVFSIALSILPQNKTTTTLFISFSSVTILVALISMLNFILTTVGVDFTLSTNLLFKSYLTTQTTSLNQAVLLSGVITCVIFVTFLINKPTTIISNALFALGLLAATALCFLTTESLFVFFFCFEILLLVSLYLLRLTSKSERVIDASVEMFFWTLAGSLGLITLFVWLSLMGINTFDLLLTDLPSNKFFGLLAILGFGVKIPVWPFFSWLLKAHVEASVEFSILLSGFIVKLGVFGLYRLVLAANTPITTLTLFGFSLLGLTIASLRLFAQRDLKRIVALTTVIEMNWLGLALASGGVVFDNLVAYIVVIHSITTSMEFLTVELITKRFGTRDCTCISGLFYSTPLFATLTFFVILITIGFPGTPLFLAKLLFLTELVSVSILLTILISFILLLILPLFFFKLWAPIWFGLPKTSNSSAYDLTSAELGILLLLIIGAVILAFWPSLIV